MFMILALKMIVIPSKNDPMIHSPRILWGSSWDNLNDEKRQYGIILLLDISFLLWYSVETDRAFWNPVHQRKQIKIL